jgi:hypothetical protein
MAHGRHEHGARPQHGVGATLLDRELLPRTALLALCRELLAPLLLESAGRDDADQVQAQEPDRGSELDDRQARRV